MPRHGTLRAKRSGRFGKERELPARAACVGLGSGLDANHILGPGAIESMALWATQSRKPGFRSRDDLRIRDTRLREQMDCFGYATMNLVKRAIPGDEIRWL